MFLRINPGAATLRLMFEDQEITATEGDSVAAALLAAGITHTRDTAVGAAPRGPFCLMGTCFDCLVEVDGVPNRQACLTPVKGGMYIRLQRGVRALA